MKKQYDLIVVGGGILGTFHAYHALQRGLTVAILEKNTVPEGATVRNFGQVVPSGMDVKWQNFGRESLNIYKELQDKADLTVRQNGSVYIASNDEEMQLIEELAVINKNNDYQSVMLTKDECLHKYDGLRADYCRGALFFPQELSVDSTEMILKLHEYLRTAGMDIYYNTTVIETMEHGAGCTATSAAGEVFTAAKIIICGGHEFKTLYPELFINSDLEVSKLQMLRTKPQGGNYTLKGNILTGLSIRRYEAFTECPSFREIKGREDASSPERKYGVHILFKQALDGSVIIGDSHQYADAAEADLLGYDLNEDIDAFMIAEAKKIIDLPVYDIQKRWFGVYSQCKTKDIFEHSPSANIHIVTGIGGKGMTGSAGFSKFNIQKIFG